MEGEREDRGAPSIGKMFSGTVDPALAFAWYAAFVFSAVLHEAAHAFAAWKLGDRSAYRGGQVSLDPWPHMKREPAGMVLVPVLMYFATGWMLGWASAPYNPFWARSYPRRAALMALAGPVANLLVVLVAAIIIKLGVSTEFFQAPASRSALQVVTAAEGTLAGTVATLVNILFCLNLLLLVLNLIPFPPLDGAAVVALLLDRNRARRYLDLVTRPSFALIGIVVACMLFWRIFDPILSFALAVLYE